MPKLRKIMTLKNEIFSSDFQPLWVSLIHYDKGLLHLLLHLKKGKRLNKSDASNDWELQLTAS